MKTRRVAFTIVLCGLLLGAQGCAFRVLETPPDEAVGTTPNAADEASVSETAPADSNAASTQTGDTPSSEPAEEISASGQPSDSSAQTSKAFIPAFEQGPMGEGCQQIALNGGMDENATWQFVGGKPARYSADQARSGAQSILAGLDAGHPYHIYSDARQWVAIPSNALSVTLRLWWYPRTEEQASSLIQRCTQGNCPTGSLAAGPLPAASDLQYILAVRPNWTFEWLLSGKANGVEWQPLEFDLTRYAGRRVAIQFGVYNDARGGLTSMFVDDVELWVCLPAQ